jgi:hypothetical protein
MLLLVRYDRVYCYCNEIAVEVHDNVDGALKDVPDKPVIKPVQMFEYLHGNGGDTE